MKDWYAFMWNRGERMKCGIVYWLELDNGGGLLYDKFGELRKAIGIDMGVDVLGYWSDLEKARAWVESMVGGKVVCV